MNKHQTKMLETIIGKLDNLQKLTQDARVKDRLGAAKVILVPVLKYNDIPDVAE